MNQEPIEAFEWLLAAFRRYTKNQMTWLEVRELLHQAEEYRDQYRAIEQHETTTYTTIQDGQIVSGGMSCYQCGKATLMSEIADPFGKSSRMRPVCGGCTQFPSLRRFATDNPETTD